jgi:hypothetical protein
MSNGFIYVVDAHFIDKIEENKYPGPKCLWTYVDKKNEIGQELKKKVFLSLCYIFGIGICDKYMSREDKNSRTGSGGTFI